MVWDMFIPFNIILYDVVNAENKSKKRLDPELKTFTK
jgi:hypothetical protein